MALIVMHRYYDMTWCRFNGMEWIESSSRFAADSADGVVMLLRFVVFFFLVVFLISIVLWRIVLLFSFSELERDFICIS